MQDDIKRLMELAGMGVAADLLQPVEEEEYIHIPSKKTIKEDKLAHDVPTMRDVADIHGVDIEEINEQVQKGIEIELEYVDDIDVAEEIALINLAEGKDYYDTLHYMDREVVEEATDFFGKEMSPAREATHEFVNSISPSEKQDFENMLLIYLEEEGHLSEEQYAEFGREVVNMLLGRYKK